MATKQFLTLDGLTTYDGLIKQYIGTEDAKSIKSITVSGNTVSFFKTADASGTAAYTVQLPDVSGFMDKIANPSGGMVVASDENGGVVETEISADSVVTGYFSDEITNNEIVIYDTTDGLVKNSSKHISDLMEKLESPSGDKVLIADEYGQAIESDLETDKLVTGYFGQQDYHPDYQKIAMFMDEDGVLTSSDLYVDDITTLQTDVSTLKTDVSDLEDEVDNKMNKIGNATGGRVVVSQNDGEVIESSSIFATGYFAGGAPAAAMGDIVVFGQDSSDQNFVNISGSGVSLSDLQSDITSAQSDADAAQDDVDALETLVGTIPQESSATTVIGYVDEQVDAIATDSEVTLTEAQTPTTGYLKTYELAQGGTLVGKIDIPKDLVVTSGEIVVNPQGQPAGTYLKLTIANQTAPVYINVADLCDVYTPASGATQVQVAISSTNEVSATLVAGGVGTTELANSAVTETKIAGGAVTTSKIADDAVTADKVAISAHTEAQTAGTDGLAISVTTTDGQVSAVSASIAAETYDSYGSASAAQTAAAGYTDSAIADLDASQSQTAGADGLALSITEVDGKITAISGSIAANTYDASGAAATAKSEVVGASGDAASASTIYGAKAYADASTAAIATSDIEALFS